MSSPRDAATVLALVLLACGFAPLGQACVDLGCAADAECAAGSACVDGECIAAPVQSHCGDGVRDADEACDDGPANDDAHGTCTKGCTRPVCNDGILSDGEECDLGPDGNSDFGPCTPGCKLGVCGDGLVQEDEECDLGALNGLQRCTGGTRAAGGCRHPLCGNGELDAEEACDEGPANSAASAFCTPSCEAPRCGDGLRSALEICDGDAPDCTGSCTAPTCGVVGVSLGMHQTYVFMRDGRLIGAGNDEEGQFGRSSSGSLGGIPVELEGDPLWRIAAGGGSGAGLTLDDRLWTWGGSSSGRLGLGDLAPHAGRVAPLPQLRFRDVATEGDHLLALDLDGNVWSWGSDATGEVGDGLELDPNCACLATPLELPGGQRWVGVFAGPGTSFLVRDDGAVYGFGRDDHMQLGDGTEPFCTPTPHVVSSPVPMAGLPPIRDIAPGSDTTLLLDVDGALWRAGRGAAIDGVDTHYCQPARLPPSLRDGVPVRFVEIEAGEAHFLAIDERGGVWGMGSNEAGALGMGGQPGPAEPAPISLPAGSPAAVAVQASWRHSAVLLSDGTLLVSGWNNYGMLGWPEAPGSGRNVFTPFPACP